ncbi:hypothetical protein [Xanthocytophaga flava]|uniref:hypothetical protein n=1 Tax=Xanthocytophaga flava TaxID=3048013 RepID=UPI0028D810C7|nr:hypothetical protein [Xanthocytophaga flavus]MDJ1473532.1 hypothetical protein [Xanthocytophaga flavus]
MLPRIKEKVIKNASAKNVISEEEKDSYAYFFGFLFSDLKKHLVITRVHHGVRFIDVFILKNQKLISIFQKEMNDLDFFGTGFKDLNGDNNNDFYIYEYSSAGCCRRNAYYVYTFDSQKGVVEKEYFFLNPTFYPEKKLVYSLEYGHPGMIDIRKLKWEGKKIDTLEIFSPDSLQFKKTVFKGVNKETITMDKVPAEYKNINDFDWFIDYLDDTQ